MSDNKPEWIQASTDDTARASLPDNITFNVVHNLRAIHEQLDRLNVPRFGDSIKPYDAQLFNRMTWLATRCRIINHEDKGNDNQS